MRWKHPRVTRVMSVFVPIVEFCVLTGALSLAILVVIVTSLRIPS